jgi:hypothetical protein
MGFQQEVSIGVWLNRTTPHFRTTNLSLNDRGVSCIILIRLRRSHVARLFWQTATLRTLAGMFCTQFTNMRDLLMITALAELYKSVFTFVF